jgi:hypothetical protein
MTSKLKTYNHCWFSNFMSFSQMKCHLDVIIRHKSQARVMSCRGGSGRLLSVAVRLLFFFKRTDDVYGGAEGREQVTRMAGRK